MDLEADEREAVAVAAEAATARRAAVDFREEAVEVAQGREVA